MATKRWYLTGLATTPGPWAELSETAASAQTVSGTWTVGTGSTFSSEFAGPFGSRASTTFIADTVPDGTLDTSLGDAFRTPVLNGTFASGSWTFQFAVISPTQGGAADGQIVFRLIKANADGSGATEITSAQQSASVCTNVSTTDINGTLTFNPGAITFVNQCLFVQVAWKRTGAGGMTTTNIALRTGSSTTVGTTILSSNFTPGDQAVTAQSIASGAKLYSDGFLTCADSYIVNPVTINFTGVICGQSISGHTGPLTYVSFWIGTLATSSDALYVELHQGTWTGTLLGTSALVPLTSISTTAGWVQFTFSSPPVLSPGTTYYIKLFRNTITSGSPSMYRNVDDSLYLGGTGTNSSGTSNGYDWKFQLGLPALALAVAGVSSQNITGGTIASGVIVSIPTVVPGSVAIVEATIVSTVIVRVPTITQPGAGPAVVTLVASAIAYAPQDPQITGLDMSLADLIVLIGVRYTNSGIPFDLRDNLGNTYYGTTPYNASAAFVQTRAYYAWNPAVSSSMNFLHYSGGFTNYGVLIALGFKGIDRTSDPLLLVSGVADIAQSIVSPIVAGSISALAAGNLLVTAIGSNVANPSSWTSVTLPTSTIARQYPGVGGVAFGGAAAYYVNGTGSDLGTLTPSWTPADQPIYCGGPSITFRAASGGPPADKAVTGTTISSVSNARAPSVAREGDVIVPPPAVLVPVRQFFADSTIAMSYGLPIAHGNFAASGSDFLNTGKHPLATAILTLPTFDTAPLVGAYVELWALMKKVDGTDSDTDFPDIGRFFGLWNITPVNALQRRTVTISLAGIEQVFFYIRNMTGVAINCTFDSPATIRICPFAVGVSHA